MSNNKFKILPVIDYSDKFKVKKDTIFDIPFRLGLVGSTMAGKTNCLVNLLARFYKNDFKGENIFLISPSIKSDDKLKKLVRFMEIPESNLFDEFDEEQLKVVYQFIKEDYQDTLEDEEESDPPNYLIIFDDCGFSNNMRSKNKKGNVLDALACNGRHYNISIIITAQEFYQISKTFRRQCSGWLLWSCPDAQLNQISKEVSIVNPKHFKEGFRSVVNQPYKFFTVNYSNKANERYMECFDKVISFPE